MLHFHMTVAVLVSVRPHRVIAKGLSIKYVTLFLANFNSLPLSHFVTHPGTPQKYVTHLGPPRLFSRPSTKPRTKAPCTNSLSIVRGGFCSRGFVRGSFVWKVLSGVVFYPFPLLSEYICYDRKLNSCFICTIKNYKCDVTCSLPPPSCQKLSHLLGLPPP